MKRFTVIMLALLLVCTLGLGVFALGSSGPAAAAGQSDASAAQETELFEELSTQVFYFSSGVGGWFTELQFAPDGSFTGTFHDSEMGETGETYPMGTVYGCLYHGRCSVLEKLSEYVWRISLDELALDEGQVPEQIEDGIRYVTYESVYGLENTSELLVYMPGMPVAELPEGYYIWSHLAFQDPQPEELPFWGLYNEADECGFVGDPIAEG